MNVKLIFFAQIREAIGQSELQLSLDANATGQQVWEWVASAVTLPDVSQAVCRLAINQQFATWDTPLSEGDEVVILTPVAGG